MIIYNKTQYKKVNEDTPKDNVEAIRSKLTEENKSFLRLLKLQIKKNV